MVARMWPEDDGTPPPMSASSGTYPGGGLLGGGDDSSAAAAAAAGGGGVGGGGWQWGRWRVSEDQLPLAVGALAGGALLILALVAAALWRCCTLSPRHDKAAYFEDFFLLASADISIAGGSVGGHRVSRFQTHRERKIRIEDPGERELDGERCAEKEQENRAH
ncbi:hypothetical protein J437_LFUL012986 [Ladona fulva]|uniref:Uncharacterized protein n=1 Tax=Ladona fulva TaxID=123851 RepID=A0A8K0KCT7_LADFU|nr:hypothetical protein J437_LFUL012986 [Ladona fulva]